MLPLQKGSETEDSLGNAKRVHVVQLDYEQGPILNNDNADSVANFLKQSHYQEIGLRFGWQTDRNSRYASMYNFPVYGIGIAAGTFNLHELGNPLTVYGFLALPLLPRTKRFNLSMDFATGIGTNFNPYNKETNPHNIVIGSKVNCYVSLGAKLNYAITPRLFLGFAYGFRHYSNGSTKRPNSGVNINPLQVSIAYTIEKRAPDVRKMAKPSFGKSRSILDLNLAAGPKNFTRDGKNYFKTSAGLYYFWQAGYKFRCGAGLDYFYSSSGADLVKSNESDLQKSSSIAFVPGAEWILTKNLYLHAGLGLYLFQHKENEETQFYYERVSIRYRIHEHLNIGFGIKANKQVADFFEYSIGYSLPSRKIEM